MRLHRHHLAALVVAIMLAACGGNTPPTLSPVGVKYWKANQAAVIVGDIQTIAIALNGVKTDTGAPVLSDANTRTVIDVVTVALRTIEKVPESWKATVTVALDEVDQHLDALGQTKLRPYIHAARAVLAQIPEAD